MLKKQTRWLVAALVVVLGTMAMGSVSSAAARPHNPWTDPWAHIASGPKYANINGTLYAEWECTITGTVVGAAITFAAPGGIELRALFGIFAGGSFTGGCQTGYPDKPTYLNGVPPQTDPSKVCAMIYPHGKKRRRFKRCAYFA